VADAAPVAQFPILDREAARSFLQYLDPDAEQFTFQTFTDSEQRKSTYQKRPETGQPIDPLARVLHGTLDQHWAALVDASRQGAGVFVVINKTTLKGRRSGDGISAVRAHFSDCDGVPKDTIKAALSLLTLTPHIITQTSTGKYHLFWCVDDAPLADFAGTQKSLPHYSKVIRTFPISHGSCGSRVSHIKRMVQRVSLFGCCTCMMATTIRTPIFREPWRKPSHRRSGPRGGWRRGHQTTWAPPPKLATRIFGGQPKY
jgi:hypothetical protein